jgi:hypothetical protein
MAAANDVTTMEVRIDNAMREIAAAGHELNYVTETANQANKNAMTDRNSACAYNTTITMAIANGATFTKLVIDESNARVAAANAAAANAAETGRVQIGDANERLIAAKKTLLLLLLLQKDFKQQLAAKQQYYDQKLAAQQQYYDQKLAAQQQDCQLQLEQQKRGYEQKLAEQTQLLAEHQQTISAFDAAKKAEADEKITAAEIAAAEKAEAEIAALIAEIAKLARN